MNLNDIERYQMKKFRWFLKRIYDFHPYYGKLLRKLKLKPNNFKTLKDLDKIPFTKKPDWVGKEKDFILTPNQKKIIHYISPWDMLLFVFKKEKFMQEIKYEYAPATFFATSGRTGTPSTCFYTRYDFELIAKQGNISTRHMVEELDNNVRLQIMFPYAPHLAFWHATFGWLNNSHIFATLLGSGRTRLQASLLDKFKINAIMGMPSYVKYFSEVAIEENTKSYVRYIILGGEAAQKALVKRIKDNFGSLGTVPTVIRTYALTESKVAIFENEEDGGYIITGMEGPFFGIYDVLLIKTDSEGNEEWNRTFGGWCDTCGRSVQQTSDGGYIIAGWVYPYLFGIGSKDVLLIKTDSKGNEEWNRTFGGSDHDCGYSVQQTSDGGYIITGYTNSSGAGESDVLLIKTDSHGNKEWAMTIGGSNLDKGYSVEQTSDGGHIIVGETYSSGTGDGDVWLIKITPPSEKEAPGFEAIFAIAGLVVLAYFLKRRKLNNG